MQRWFLSYNSRDLNLVLGLQETIRRKDPRAHIFFAPKSLSAGGYWLPRLAEEIAQATAFVLVVGEKGLGPWQVVEYYEALDKRVKTPDFPIVLVLLEGQPAPGLPFLRQLHWIVSSDPSSEQVAARLAESGAGGGSRPGELWRYTSPYRGLAAMTDADSDFFFGRQAETRQVLQVLSAGSDRLPVLLGNSGVGKSSLAQAGVLAALKRQALPEANGGGAWPQAFHDSRRWCFLSFKPATEPLKALVDPFLEMWQFATTDPERANQQNGWIALLRDGKAGLGDLIDATERRYQELDQPKPPAFFIYVDQGEELYVRSAEDDRRRFSQLLAQALGDPRVHALMSMRADFLGALQNDEALYAVHHKIDVPPLREAELCEVVSRPAALLSARFETDGLAADIARRTAEESAKDAGALPLLSYLLDDMWTQMVRRGDGVLRLPAQAMELGGVLAERANAFLARYPRAEETLRRVLTLKLATVREDGDPTRRIARRSEFTDEEWRMVSELADHPHRLLVTAAPEGGETYAEVAHEAIFRRWGKLRDWIVAEREFLLWKSGLEADRRRWEHSPEASRNDALLMGLSLAQAQSWLARRAEDLPRADREFIDLSVQREVLERRQREALRRRMFGTAIVALAGMTALALFSFFQWREALAQRDRAEHAVASFATQMFSTSGRDAEDLNQAISTDPSDATNYYLRAWFNSRQDEYDRVIADLDRVIELNPNFVAAYLVRGSMYEKKDDYDRAIADYDRALGLDPRNAMIYRSRGWTYHLKRLPERAITDYNEAIRLNPNYSIAYNSRGIEFSNKGELDRAIADYDQAIKLNPKYASPYNNRGLVYRKKGDYDRALADFDDAIKLDPKNAIYYYNRGLDYGNKDELDRAIADYDQAIKLNPKYASAYNSRGLVHGKKRNYDRALADFNEAINLDPKNAIYYYNRGLDYSNKGEPDRALGDYDQAIQLNPKYAIAYNNRGLIYHRKGDYDRALADYDQAIMLDPDYGLAYGNRGFTRYMKRDYDGAVADYDRAIELRSNSASAYINRGVIYRIRGAYDRAIADFDEAIKHGPNSSRAYYHRGSVYRARGQRDQALKDYAQAIALDRNEAGSVSARCWLRLRDREMEAALADCNKSLELRAGDAYALDARGVAYLALGRAADARASFDAALEIEPKLASSLHGRGLAKRKTGDADGGNADIAAAVAIRDDVAADFARLGIR